MGLFLLVFSNLSVNQKVTTRMIFVDIFLQPRSKGLSSPGGGKMRDLRNDVDLFVGFPNFSVNRE